MFAELPAGSYWGVYEFVLPKAALSQEDGQYWARLSVIMDNPTFDGLHWLALLTRDDGAWSLQVQTEGEARLGYGSSTATPSDVVVAVIVAYESSTSPFRMVVQQDQVPGQAELSPRATLPSGTSGSDPTFGAYLEKMGRVIKTQGFSVKDSRVTTPGGASGPGTLSIIGERPNTTVILGLFRVETGSDEADAVGWHWRLGDATAASQAPFVPHAANVTASTGDGASSGSNLVDSLELSFGGSSGDTIQLMDVALPVQQGEMSIVGSIQSPGAGQILPS
jgi:hypothetical protein